MINPDTAVAKAAGDEAALDDNPVKVRDGHWDLDSLMSVSEKKRSSQRRKFRELQSSCRSERWKALKVFLVCLQWLRCL